jgi:hypothetical protein
VITNEITKKYNFCSLPKEKTENSHFSLAPDLPGNREVLAGRVRRQMNGSEAAQSSHDRIHFVILEFNRPCGELLS